MAENCDITFSPYLANQDLPEHDVVAGNWYWASDQEVLDENGNLVRLIGHRFLQREDETPEGEPPLYVGNAYLKYADCTQTSDGVITCQLGACVVGDCCYQTVEGLCPGEFQGPNTACELPDCYAEGACCAWTNSIDCYETTRIVCTRNTPGWFGEGRTCDEMPPYCKGACCIYDVNKGTFCVPDVWPSECRDIQDQVPEGVWTIWLGPETTCENEGADCPDTGGCCRPPNWECENTTPDDCTVGPLTDGNVFTGLGNFCSEDSCNGACCTNVFSFPGPLPPAWPGCVDDVSKSECEPGVSQVGHFLGAGSTCIDNVGDCGVCCLVNPANGEIECRTDLLQVECLEAGGTPFGPGSQCAICDTVTRACCVPPSFRDPPGIGDEGFPCDNREWKCKDVSKKADCTALGGIFRPDRNCGDFPCFLLSGGCCCPAGFCPFPPCNPPDPGDQCTCTDTLAVDCPEQCVWRGPGRTCWNPDSGEPPRVPPRCLVDCELMGCDPVPDP